MTFALLLLALFTVQDEKTYEGKTVKEWYEALKAGEAKAVRIVAEVGPDFQYASSSLVRALDHKDARTRELAVVAFYRINPEGDQAIPELKKHLENSRASERSRINAVRALQRFEENEKAANAIAAALTNAKTDAMRNAAAKAFIEAKKGVYSSWNINTSTPGGRALASAKYTYNIREAERLLTIGDFSNASKVAGREEGSGNRWIYMLQSMAARMTGKSNGISLMEEAARRSPGDTYPPLWIWGFSGKNEKLKALKLKDNWISNVVKYYLGSMTEAQLMQRARQAPNDKARNGQLCEAYCYIGLKAERDGNLPKALEQYRLSVKTGVSNYVEYFWSSARLGQETKEVLYDGRPLNEWIAKFEGDDLEARLDAADLLWRIGPAAKPALSAALRALEGIDAPLAQVAAKVILHIGDPSVIPALLKNADWLPEAMAAAAGFGEKAVPGIIKLLGHEDPDTRLGAVQVLGFIAKEAGSAAPALFEVVKNDSDLDVRTVAGESLALIGPPAGSATALVELSINAKDVSFQLAVHRCLYALEKIDEPVIAQMRKHVMETENQNIQANFAGLIGKHSKEVPPELLELLKTESTVVRKGAVQGVGEAETVKAAEALIKSLKVEKDSSLAQATAENIGRCKAAAVPALLKAFDEGTPSMRLYTGYALWLTEAPIEGEEILLKGLAAEEGAARQGALLALGRLKDPSADCLDAMAKAIREDTEFLAGVAATALEFLNRPTPEQIQAIKDRAIKGISGDDRDKLGSALLVLGGFEALRSLYEHENSNAKSFGKSQLLINHWARSLDGLLSGDLEAAIAHCNEVLKIRPDYYSGYRRRGMAYSLLGQRDKALTDFQTALKASGTSNFHDLMLELHGGKRRTRNILRNSVWLPGLYSFGTMSPEPLLQHGRMNQRLGESKTYLIPHRGVVGLVAEQAGKKALARRHYRAALEERKDTYYFYMWALNRAAGWTAADLGIKVGLIPDEAREFLSIDRDVGVAVVSASGNGLQAKDIIVSVDGEEVGPRAFWRLLGKATPGTTLKLGVLRQNKKVEVSLTLEAKGFLGVEWGEIPESARQFLPIKDGVGLMVAGMAEGSAMKLQKRDIVVTVDGADATRDAVSNAVRGKKPGDMITFKVLRRGRELTIAVKLTTE